jgi:hypothetical protein
MGTRKVGTAARRAHGVEFFVYMCTLQLTEYGSNVFSNKRGYKSVHPHSNRDHGTIKNRMW